MQKNVSGQTMIVFAFNKTNNEPLTGDAANITANIRKDNGAAAAVTDTNPTETEDGFYSFDLTQAETNADVIQGFPSSVTADIQVISVPGVIYTTPVSFADGVVQSADNNTLLSSIDSDYSKFNPAVDIVANVTLVDTTTTNTDMVGTDNALLAASYTAPDNAGITANGVAIDGIPTLAQFNARTLLSADYFVVTDYTAPDNAGITQTQVDIAALNNISATDILTTQMTESYAADGIAPTLAQALFINMQNLQDFSFTGTTQTVKKIDGSTTAATYTLNDAVTPTSKTRAT